MNLDELVLPGEARVMISTAQAEHHKIVQRGMENPPKKACPNCMGMGFLWFNVIKRGPFKSVPGFNYAAGERTVILEDSWYVTEEKIYTCPMCTDPRIRKDFLMRRSGLEQVEKDWNIHFLEGLEGKEIALDKAKALLKSIPEPVGWITLHGDNGVGKSGLLKAIVAGCVKEGVAARYIRAAELLAKIRATYDEDPDTTEEQIVDLYSEVQLLAVDEVDRISNTNWAQSTLMMILDRRYNRRDQEATMLATNCDPESMPAGFEYLASRMKDGDRIRMAGKDMRG